MTWPQTMRSPGFTGSPGISVRSLLISSTMPQGACPLNTCDLNPLASVIGLVLNEASSLLSASAVLVRF